MPDIITAANRPYKAYGGAKQLMYCQDKEVLIEGPAGTGKSRGSLEKANLCAMKYKGCRILFTRKTRRSMTESVLVTFEEKVLTENSPIKSGAGREHRHSYKYSTGSEIICEGMENADRIMSTEYDLIFCFEGIEFSEDEIEKLTTRLRNGVIPFQQLIVDTNPGPPTHFLNQRANSGRMTRILSRHEDNPTVTKEYLNTLQNLTGARRARLYEGRWASQEGLVYEFDPAVHMMDRFDIPVTWQRYRVIDFGYTNPFVCQWWAKNPDDELFMYREIYFSGRIVSEHAKQINELSKGERYVLTIADHDAEDRATLHANGIQTVAAIKDIDSGIQSVHARLKVKANGRPSLYLFHDTLVERDQKLVELKKPVCTREEFDSYAYHKSQDGKAIKEAPVKVDDHGQDCLRYLCKQLSKPTQQSPKYYFIK
jgi:phage terminase large subunit